MFARLYSENPAEFSRAFGTDERRIEYWRTVANREPWFALHPNIEEFLRRPQWCCPLALHGDDVCCKRGLTPLSALVQSLSSPVAWAEFDSLYLLACVVLKRLQDDSLRFLYGVIKWSMNCLADGRWPERDHLGRPFAGDGTYRGRYAGHWLAP
eukprot:1297699-Pyramimonas_sp.AAC.1